MRTVGFGALGSRFGGRVQFMLAARRRTARESHFLPRRVRAPFLLRLVAVPFQPSPDSIILRTCGHMRLSKRSALSMRTWRDMARATLSYLSYQIQPRSLRHWSRS